MADRYSVDSTRSVYAPNKYRGTSQRESVELLEDGTAVAEFDDLSLADRVAELLNKHGAK